MAIEKKTILLVEDDEILIDALSMKLTQSGFKVAKCMSGDLVLDSARKSMPDLILLDIILPRVKGTVVLRQLKNDPHLKEIPVIMLTNLSPQPSLTEEMKGAEPMFYLVKTHSSLNDIVEKVKDAFERIDDD